jgi:hypothetical protein
MKFRVSAHVLFVENRHAAPFADPQPSVSAFCGVPALFSGSSFPAAAAKIFCVVFFPLVLIAAALDRGPFLPRIIFWVAYHYLLLAFRPAYIGSFSGSQGFTSSLNG